METRKIKLSFEQATEWYKGDNEALKEIALKTFPELKPKAVTERIKTWDDVKKELGISLEVVRTINASFPKHLTCQWQVEQIVKALNEGWEPNWDDSNEYKYYPWFDMRSSGGGFSFDVGGRVSTRSGVGSRLCFKSSELAKYAATQFKDIYEGMFKG